MLANVTFDLCCVLHSKRPLREYQYFYAQCAVNSLKQLLLDLTLFQLGVRTHLWEEYGAVSCSPNALEF